MQFGAAMFFTDYSMAPGELGAALEARGFESLWAPEHSHIPVSRTSPFPNGGDLPKQYYDVMGRVEDWRAGLAELFDCATFPAPSTSHAACGFPALRAPIRFMSRLMGPIMPGQLSTRRISLDSC